MKKSNPYSIMTLAAALLFTSGLFAQVTTEVTVKVKKDGKVVKDTTYTFEGAAEAEHAAAMIEILGGEDEHVMKYNYTTSSDNDKHSNTMVFISEDGKKTEIKHMSGDSLVWVSDEGSDDKDVKKKRMKVVVTEDTEGGTWETISKEGDDGDENVYVISGDKDVKVEVEKIIKEENGDDIKVIVVKKIHEDDDQDVEKDVDNNVDVKVDKRVKKKSK